MTRVLIAGGTGFLGEAVTDRMLASDASEVMVLARNEPSRSRSRIRFVGTEWNDAHRNREVAAFRPDVLVNLIGTSHPRSSLGCEVHEVEQNLLPFLRLMETLESCGLRRVVFSSSAGAIYEAGNKRVQKRIVDSPYAATKLSTEHYLSAWAATSQLSAASLRISNPVGQVNKAGFGIVNHFARAVVAHREVEFLGDYEIAKDYVALADVADVVCSVATQREMEPGHHILDVGSGWSVDAKGMFELVTQLISRQHWENAEPREFDMVRSELDLRETNRVTGWSPCHNVVHSIWQVCRAQVAAFKQGDQEVATR